MRVSFYECRDLCHILKENALDSSQRAAYLKVVSTFFWGGKKQQTKQ